MKLYNRLKGKLNLKIGAHLKLASSQLFRQKFLIDFVYRASMAVALKDDESQG